MSKVVTAEYDAAARTLRLDEPLEGVGDREKVELTVNRPGPDSERPWLQSRGALSKEAGEELARAVEEMFPPWNEGE